MFQALPLAIGADRTLWATLERYHTRRNKSEYEGLSTVSDAEARELAGLAAMLRDRLVKAEVLKWGKVVKESGLRLD